jgi:homoserine dehydrogenase
MSAGPEMSSSDRPRRVRLCLAGAGHVGAGFLAMLRDQHTDIARRYGVDLRVTGIAEYGGGAMHPEGLDLDTVLETLGDRRPLAGLPGCGRPGMTPTDLVEQCPADFLLEATPVNLVDGQPGLGTVRGALSRGLHVVLANKGPLALAYPELHEASDLADGWGADFRLPARGARRSSHRPRLRFSATVAGALPVVNMGRRDLAGDRITRIEAVFNGTTQSILRAMEHGKTFADALADAQERGIAEADASLDVDGHDAACKLVITVNAVLGLTAKLDDLEIEGIGALDGEQVAAELAQGRRIVLLCLAEREDGGGFRLSVRPAPLPLGHPLCRLTPDEMGVVYYTDHVDRLFAASLEPGPEPASAAMLRDVLDIIRSETCQHA